jgi:hypothetical protein
VPTFRLALAYKLATAYRLALASWHECPPKGGRYMASPTKKEKSDARIRTGTWSKFITKRSGTRRSVRRLDHLNCLAADIRPPDFLRGISVLPPDRSNRDERWDRRGYVVDRFQQNVRFRLYARPCKTAQRFLGEQRLGMTEIYIFSASCGVRRQLWD